MKTSGDNGYDHDIEFLIDSSMDFKAREYHKWNTSAID